MLWLFAIISSTIELDYGCYNLAENYWRCSLMFVVFWLCHRKISSMSCRVRSHCLFNSVLFNLLPNIRWSLICSKMFRNNIVNNCWTLAFWFNVVVKHSMDYWKSNSTWWLNIKWIIENAPKSYSPDDVPDTTIPPFSYFHTSSRLFNVHM
jgi:hypothetical protein